MALHEVDSLLRLDLPKCTCGARQSLRAVGFYRKSTNVLYDNYVHQGYLFKINMVGRGVQKDCETRHYSVVSECFLEIDVVSPKFGICRNVETYGNLVLV